MTTEDDRKERLEKFSSKVKNGEFVRCLQRKKRKALISSN